MYAILISIAFVSSLMFQVVTPALTPDPYLPPDPALVSSVSSQHDKGEVARAVDRLHSSSHPPPPPRHRDGRTTGSGEAAGEADDDSEEEEGDDDERDVFVPADSLDESLRVEQVT